MHNNKCEYSAASRYLWPSPFWLLARWLSGFLALGTISTTPLSKHSQTRSKTAQVIHSLRDLSFTPLISISLLIYYLFFSDVALQLVCWLMIIWYDLLQCLFLNTCMKTSGKVHCYWSPPPLELPVTWTWSLGCVSAPMRNRHTTWNCPTCYFTSHMFSFPFVSSYKSHNINCCPSPFFSCSPFDWPLP